MKKHVRIIGVLLILFSLVFQMGASAESERIKAIDVDVVLDSDGTARITQKWDISTHSGTEFFIPITNLNDMEIENFRVSDETGREFEFVENWDVNGSIEDKAYKNGFNKISGGVELCWGKGSFGDHVYTVSWDYKNAVQSFTDYDGFIIRFVNDQMEPPPESVSIRISKPDTPLTNENTRIWAFGYEGDILFKPGGVVEGKSSRALNRSEYMNIMMSFEKGIFFPLVSHSTSFNDVIDRAMEGATSYDPSDSSSDSSISSGPPSMFRFFNPAVFFAPFIIFFLAILGVIFGKGFGKSIDYYKDGLKINLYPNNIPKMKKERDIDYYRELPIGNDLQSMFYVKNLYNMNNEMWSDLIASHILKWIKSGNIVPEERVETKGIIFTKEVNKVALALRNMPDFESNSENKLWEMISQAAGSDSVLEEKEFERYFRKQYTEIDQWKKMILRDGGVKFLDAGGLEITNQKTKSAKTMLTPQGEQYIWEYYGFKKYLDDFTLIAERGINELRLWDDYLIIGTLMGIGKEVSEQMEKLVPNYVFGQNYDPNTSSTSFYTNYILFNTARSFASQGMRGYTAATSSSSSGGGGSSFSGGGGGFSGGGSGGGSR